MAKRKRLQYHHQQLQLMSNQVTDGTDVAETLAAEKKPTETKTNHVVVDMKNPDSMKQHLGMAKRKRLWYQQQ
jgi:hypothetical protein